MGKDSFLKLGKDKTSKGVIGIPVYLLLMLIFLTGCSKEVDNPTSTPILTKVHPTTLPIQQPSSSFTEIESTSTPSDEELESFEKFSKIEVTQGPVIISTSTPPDNIYLYHNVVVYFRLSEFNTYSRSYLNLDNFADTTSLNSDIILDISRGSEGKRFNIYPTNFAKYYFSGKSQMTYESCIDQFPTDNRYTIDKVDSFGLGTVKPYCILTNEGRIAIINYLLGSDFPDDQMVVNLGIMVTVFQKKAESIFTPVPTETPGPSPTPTNKFSVNGLSDQQANDLNIKVQKFIDAVNARDEESILNMVSYPLIVRIGTKENYTLNTQKEFLEMYDQVFSEKFNEAVSQATLSDLVGGGISIYLNFGQEIIYFTKNGEIREIDNYID